jgi:hypothetical protein
VERRRLRGFLIRFEAVDECPQAVDEAIDLSVGTVRRISDCFPIDWEGKLV